MTFSIVAVDRETNATGFAIASCSWDAGQVALAKAGKGSIASQARGNIAFLGQFFEKLKAGRTVEEILSFFKETDPRIQFRQVGMITMDGRALSYTGERCSWWAGHRSGVGYACQGNILVGPEVIEKMEYAFTSTGGELVDRLYAALKAGDDAGGDSRGKQSSRLYVVQKGGGYGGQDLVIDIRVVDHHEPVREVGRILTAGKDVFTAFALTNEVENAPPETKLEAIEKLEGYLRDSHGRFNVDAHLTLAYAKLELGLKEEAVKVYRKILEASPAMEGYFRDRIERQELPKEIL